MSNAFKPGGAFSNYNPRSHKVYGIICCSNNKILIVRGRKTGIWSLPKGHFKGNELAHECALREMYEETGIVLKKNDYKSIQKLYVAEYFIYNLNDEIIPIIHDKNEISEAGWYSLNELNEFHCNVDIMYLINRVNKGLIYI
jgi:8-oxo-dGTP pyrophosphatase MutT (NUDIX family)